MVNAALILKDKSSPAVALLAVAVGEYGPDCFDWDPLVLRTELNEDFGILISAEQSNKLQAAILIISSDLFETEWHTFNSCIHALNGEPFEYDTFNPVEAEQIVAAMPEVTVIRNDFLQDETEFSDEVNAFAGVIFSEYGLFSAPAEFPAAIMPEVSGEYHMDSQTEKKEALSEIYTAKKQKIAEYLHTLE